MIHRKKLIEVALPLDAINAASAREKSIRHGHPSTLHLWWARRPLAAARAVIFAQMVDDPSSRPDLFPTAESQEAERQRLFQIIEELVQWENTTNEELLERARKEIWESWRRTCEDNKDHPRAADLFNPDKLPAFHDPFAGGGALPLEAQRLGLESYASDLNPVAVLINKAMIEIPPRFAGRPPIHPKALTPQPPLPQGEGEQWRGAQGLAEDVRYYGQWMRDEAERRIGHLYPKIEITDEMAKERPDLKPYLGKQLTVIAWLWVRTVKSPNPAFAHVDVPLASTFMLSTKPGKEAYVEPVIEGGGYRFAVKVGKPKDAQGAKNGTKLARGANFRCLMSGTPIAGDYIKAEGRAGRMGARLMAIVAEGERGRVYLAPTPEHEAAARQAKPDWRPENELIGKCRDQLPLYGMNRFADLFTPRQLVALTTFSDLVGEAMARVRRDGASPPGPLSMAGEGERSSATSYSMAGEGETSPPGTHAMTGEGETSPPGTHAMTGDEEGKKYRGIVRSPAITEEKARLAAEFRKQPTEAEARAWEILRDRRLLGLKFRRQQPIRGFIVDFYCPEHRLALELDGAVHERQAEYDQARDQILASEDIRVLRVRNEDVSPQRLQALVSAALSSPSPTQNPRPGNTATPSSESVHGPTPSPEPGQELTPSPEMERGLGGEDTRPLRDGGTGATAYAEAVGMYLGMAVDYAANYWSVIATPADGFIRGTFARQALPMTWDYAEAPPFGNTSGNWMAGIEWAAKAMDALPIAGAGTGTQADAAVQSISAGKVISTDPPYYDNIGYADLSDFFYVWLRRSLRSVFPDLFATLAVPKAEELVATPYRHGSKEKAEAFFLDGMTQAMHRLAEQAHPAFPVTIYYAFKQSENESDEGTASTGWETFLDAVIRSGFAISGTWPMRTERGARSIGIGTNALASSIVLVCRPRPANAPTATRREFVQTLKAELPPALQHLQRGNIAPVDLAQAAIGPGMAVYTRYARVLDAEGRPVSVREALALINQTLDEALAEQEGDFDADSRWALAWFEQHGFAEGEFGVAETLSKAKNTSVAGMVEAGIVASARGKVRLLRPEELPADWDPALDERLTAWETVHQLIRALESGGESGAAALVARLGSQAEVARELAYRLYTLCERKKRAAEALSYNALVQSWPEIARLAHDSSRKTKDEQLKLMQEYEE
jgi:adenine-specific DNA methylase/very-short-patch-repair endonuclease